MPGLLGKRKSRSTEEEPDAIVNAQELLRRHFEARFKPLDIAARAAPAKPTAHNDSRGDDSDVGHDARDGEADLDESDSEWDGISDDDSSGGEETEAPAVEVVDHTSTVSTTSAKMSKQELKTYLSSRPPDPSRTAAQPTVKKTKTQTDEDQPEDSAALLANDLALQRLIAESHILSAAGANPSHWQSQHAAGTATNLRPFAAGRTARKTTDMRIQALGAKESILTQAKMPMSMRKGIVSAAAAKEEKRRREARENGIILEREVKKTKTTKKKGRGERPVDLPAVGRMRGAELRVSAREARAIAESVRGPAGKGKGKRRRR
ncbi:hypothetical protein MYCTH_101762 [Thermothelomyces thermophilus ATCC 42464]|uniref:Protein FAF1 n=1 Tax=Thermothelomyces thermophilus (strain ATCC 42464 / BCRC 31852 / DSM 1799) TaxID=573729 RepID=G2QEF2_THET4|nr:uncharacterized protein MYCTH_101762 [Thermothelomyces thermophilus ATCC 42464]AEO57735.1 hypothetical protein MYCTH_101762 [Thermothelomyces thermophilus ATCC 42464]